jgi:hypothetical protein
MLDELVPRNVIDDDRISFVSLDGVVRDVRRCFYSLADYMLLNNWAFNDTLTLECLRQYGRLAPVDGQAVCIRNPLLSTANARCRQRGVRAVRTADARQSSVRRASWWHRLAFVRWRALGGRACFATWCASERDATCCQIRRYVQIDLDMK